MVFASEAAADGIETPIASDDIVTVNAKRAADVAAAHAAARAAGDPAAALREYARMEQCEGPGYVYPATLGSCPGADGAVPLPDCAGFPALAHLWTRTRPSPDAPWGPWSKVADASCPQDLLPPFTAEDFRRLPLAPTTTTLHPGTPNLLTGLGVVATADPTTQELAATLLDFPITVRATPTQYTWDFGDGTAPLTTTHPGSPFPPDARVINGSFPPGVIGHPFPRPGSYSITLTTTWAGEYQIAGATTWLPVNGTATTTTAHTPVTVYESRSHLVADTCHANPAAPGC